MAAPPGGCFQRAMEAQSGEPLMHLPEVAPIKSDQEPLLPIDGLVPFHSECAATISLVSCKTINGDFPVPALSVLPVFKQLKDREKTLLEYSGLRAGPGQSCEKAGLAPSGQRTLPVFPPSALRTLMLLPNEMLPHLKESPGYSGNTFSLKHRKQAFLFPP